MKTTSLITEWEFGQTWFKNALPENDHYLINQLVSRRPHSKASISLTCVTSSQVRTTFTWDHLQNIMRSNVLIQQLPQGENKN